MPASDSPRYDPAEPEDLPGAWQVYLAASAPASRDSTRSPDPTRPDLPPRLYPHLLATSEGAFWVARIREQVVGFGAATVRGNCFFVSELWVAPGYAGRGIGSRLYSFLKRSTRGLRGRVRAALAGDDAASLALGLRDGLQARFPVFRLEGDADAADRLWSAPGRTSRERLVPYAPKAGAGPRSPITRLDQATRGGARPMDHVFWLGDPERKGFVVWLARRPVAYLYVTERGEVGPVAASGTTGMDLALRHATRQAARRAGKVVLRVPAINHQALGMLLKAGFRLTGGSLLLSSGEFGRLDRYLPGDESLF